MIRKLSMVLACLSALLGQGGEAEPPKPPDLIQLLPEMERSPDVDGQPHCEDPKVAAAHLPHVRAAWTALAPEVQQRLTPEAVRALSRWAKKQMEGYKKVPPVANAAWTLSAASDDRRTLVFEATLDTLPTHSPIVTRWLKGYLLFDAEAKHVTRVTLTIRGQLLE